VDPVIEVRYAGVVVGRATQVRDWTPSGAFIGFAEPLPTGTRIELCGEETREARIEEAIESSDPSQSGMRVRFEATSSPAPSASPSSATAPEAASPPAAPQPAGGHKRRRRR
jgi:hypothetical protein